MANKNNNKTKEHKPTKAEIARAKERFVASGEGIQVVKPKKK